MKRYICILSAALLLFTAGCGPKIEYTADMSEFDRQTALKSDIGGLLTENFVLEDIFDDRETEGIRLACVPSAASAVFTGVRDGVRVFAEVDLYGGGVLNETETDADIYCGTYELGGKYFALCADEKEDGLETAVYSLSDGEKKTAFESGKLPFAAVCGEKLYLTASRFNGDVLYSFDGETLEQKAVFEHSQKGGTHTGEMVTAMGGGDALYLQISEVKNGLPREKKSRIEVYDGNFERTDIVKTDEALSFAAGAEELVFACAYSSEEPLKSNGRIIDLKNGTVTVLEEMNAGDDMLACFSMDGLVFMPSAASLYIYDVENDCVSSESIQTTGWAFSEGNGQEQDYGRLFALQSEKEIKIYRRDSRVFSDDFTEEEKKTVKTELLMSRVETLYRSENFIYYEESSQYGKRPLQGTECILWRMDGEGNCQKLEKYEYIVREKPTADTEKGVLTIDLGDGRKISAEIE